MRFFIPLLVIAVLVASFFLPWMTIETKNITITGLDTTGTTFGKPAYFHLLWVAFYLLFLMINRVWSRRVAMVFGAFNVAWAFRNFLVLPMCQMGECPERRIGLYLLFFSSIALFFAGMIAPDRQTAGGSMAATDAPSQPPVPNA